MNSIKLMADYGCYPLWKDSANEVGNIDPDTLPISGALKQRLAEWAKRYDNTLKPDDPLESGFSDAAQLQKFEDDGRSLTEALNQELQDKFTVTYVA